MVERVSAHRSEDPFFGLKRQASLTTLLLSCGIIAAAVLSVFLQQRLSVQTERAFDVDIPKRVLAHGIMFQVSECGQRDRDFEMGLDDADTRRKTLDAWRLEYDRLRTLLDRHDELLLTRQDHARLARWDKKRSAYGSAFLETADRVERGDLKDRLALRKALNTCRSNARELVADAQAYIQSRNAKDESRGAVQATIKTHTRLTSACVTIALLVVLLSSVWIIHVVLKRVSVLAEAAEQFAGGDRTIRVASHANDELGLLAKRFNEIVSTVKGSGNDLEQANRTARDASRVKSRLLDSLSQELRPPTTELVDSIDMIMHNLPNPECMEAARTARSKGEHLLGIMNNLHDWSRIEAGSLDIKRAPCDPYHIMAEVASAMQVRAKARGLELKIEHEGPLPPTIRTDAKRLSQILSGLVGNAIQSTEIGKVRLVARDLPKKNGGPKLQFDVVDTGIGWTDLEMANLFDPLIQHDLSEQGDTLSVGLGLTLAKQLTDLLGGTIKITSAVGSGSTYSVTIDTGPLNEEFMAKRPAEATVQRETKVQPSAKKPAELDCRVLLAEDGPENQRLISFVLSKAGMDVSVAENGQIAVEMALPENVPADASQRSGSPFDIILMDMQMPVMDGYEATRTLRQRGYRGPIIAVTGNTLSFTRQKCLDAGCDDYMSKPLDRAALLSLVARFSPSRANSS